MTTYTATEARQIIRNAGTEDATAGLREFFNCQEASIDDAGDVYVTGPMAGHWLPDAKIIEFVEWAMA